MTFIEPLALETIILNVFSGTPEIFTAVALVVLAGLAGYFRMNMLSMFFMFGTFLLMFSAYTSPSIILFILIIAGISIGMIISKIVGR